MEENNKTDVKVIDVIQLYNKLWGNRRLFYKTIPIAFVLAYVIILGFPRYYKTEIKLAPEVANSGTSGMLGSLGSLASSLGMGKNLLQTEDAISPMLYPDLMEDNAFVTSMFSIMVTDKDGEINTTYHDYLMDHQKVTIWIYPFYWLSRQFAKITDAENNKKEFNPYYLSKAEDKIAEKVRDNIKIDINKKTGVITLSTKAQDPVICKTLGDSVKVMLQKFITEYRTNKARKDFEYYKKLTLEAKNNYEKTRQIYASFSDASTKISLRSVELKMEDMENDMQLKYNTYTTLNTQMQAAKAKVQERTPAFTLLKGAAVPVKPAGPKRMIFVLAVVFLTFIGTSIYVLTIKNDA